MIESAVVSGVLGAVLEPLVQKISESAGKTFGEKVAESATKKDFWAGVKRLFIKEVEEGEKKIEEMESKQMLSDSDISELKQGLENALEVEEDKKILIDALKLDSVNIKLVNIKLKVIKALEEQIETLSGYITESNINAGDFRVQRDMKERLYKKEIEELIEKILKL